ncbi:MAG: HD domain-containing protein [Acidimicrobiia bacterium]
MTVEELLALLALGTEHDDEEHVDILAHSLQCAALLAERHPDDRELQLAGLVHDVGWILCPDDAASHGSTGAAAIAALLGHRVAWLVSWHADAKRYLVTTDPEYRARLSERSIVTLVAQGGLMDEVEVEALAAAPDLDALLELRRADDDAKVPGLAVPGLDAWTPLLTSAVG